MLMNFIGELKRKPILTETLDYGSGVKVLDMIKQTPAADVVELQGLTLCDVCAYNPPSSGDGKPCTMCPASARIDE